MSETVDWLRFRAAGHGYAVEERWVRAVEGCERLQLNPRPGGPSGWLLGIEGDLPVTSLARAARAPGQPPARRPGPGGQVIVLDAAGGTTGLWVDSVAGREEVPVARLRGLPPVARNGLFRRMALAGGDIVLEVSPEATRDQVAAGDFRATERASRTLDGEDTQPVLEGGIQPMAGVDTPADAGTPVSAPAFELPPVHGEGERRLLLFATGPEGRMPFGLNARQALEVLTPRQVRPVPGAPAYLLGLVSWRDEPIAAVDLEARLGLAPRTAAFSRLLVVRSRDREEVAAFGVDRVVTIRQEPFRYRQLPPPPDCRADLLRGVFEEAGQRFILPDIDRVLRLPPEPADSTLADAPGSSASYWA
jgi:purine-binding chemotaxis protein CheW